MFLAIEQVEIQRSKTIKFDVPVPYSMRRLKIATYHMPSELPETKAYIFFIHGVGDYCES